MFQNFQELKEDFIKANNVLKELEDKTNFNLKLSQSINYNGYKVEGLPQLVLMIYFPNKNNPFKEEGFVIDPHLTYNPHPFFTNPQNVQKPTYDVETLLKRLNEVQGIR